MATAPTRVRLNAIQKHTVCRYKEENPHLTLRQLCAWAATEFALPREPSRMALHDLLKAQVSAEAAQARPNLRSAQPVASTKLESALVQWIARCERLNLPLVSWASIRYKAAKLRRALLEQPGNRLNDRLSKLRFSDGWLQALLKRHCLQKRRVHGEAASASGKDVAQEPSCKS
ncbi:hypothetical protein ACHHYP_20249 [Achlya hypogyna]|uniref:HTH CENPB-type domain-containing protein n=1 Tax=Achlya hypogyna TaxID=1202772 RepID=A0A1V9ZN92_ACHHY|nr:hypothetical protein ACHHYP_20249 [Achlya hypogyna]